MFTPRQYLSRDHLNMRPLVTCLFRFLRLILIFYKNYFIASTTISLFCAYVFWTNGIRTFFYLFWFKILTLGLIVFFLKTYKNNEFYYYQNLGISKIVLWTTSLFIDFLIFLWLLTMTYKFK